MDIEVVGAGTVGSYLAMKLGSKARVIDKQKEVTRKTCGGLISKKGLDELNIPYEKAVLNEVKGARIHAGKEEIEVKREDTQAYVLDVLKLKEEIQEKAMDEGAEFEFGKTWKRGSNGGRFLVGADGVLSTVAKEKSFRNSFYHTYQIVTDWNRDRDSVDLYFGSYSPEFFGWIIPHEEGRAKIGIATMNRDPRKALNKFVGTERIDTGEIYREESAPIPLYNPRKKILGSKWALVGDAAGQVKATTGGGVVLGCRSAGILAEALEKEEIKLYGERYRREIEPMLKDHLDIRKFLNKINKEKLLRKLNKAKVSELIEEYGEMEETNELKKAVLKKPRLWPLLVKYLVKTHL